MNWILSAMLPLVIQVITPLLTETVKRIALALLGKLPRSVVAVTATALGEVVNQLQAILSGVSLPLGISGLIAMTLNELVNDLTKGLKDAPAS